MNYVRMLFKSSELRFDMVMFRPKYGIELKLELIELVRIRVELMPYKVELVFDQNSYIVQLRVTRVARIKLELKSKRGAHIRLP